MSQQFAVLVFRYPAHLARALADALSPETASEVPKTSGRASVVADGLRIEITAEDIPSLRAALNSYCRWVDAAEKAARLAR